ncbi:sodium- and chloride-dependent neutral and basic amino acid transporter B(0+)-like isoform X3 [Penaeus chinensis]|nr:sodium- and chloride-dependent neutral and basic amino acid transporter B(0+)-like isoform X3 [Penaeus chinensis]
MALGQYLSIGPTHVFCSISPGFCGVGWAMVLVLMLETIYYNIGIAWTLFYTVSSFQARLPWCNNTDCSKVENHYKAAALYFNQSVLGEGRQHDSEINVLLLLCLGVAWCLLAAVIARGIGSLGKVLYITIGVAYITLPMLLVASYANSDGTKWVESIIQYMSVDTDNLLKGSIWSEAATQVMYSLGLAHAGIQTLASYNTFRHNILRDAVLLVLLDTATSILCTLVMFSSLASIGEDLPTEEQELTQLLFVVFPALLSKINTIPWPTIVFCMIFSFGFNSQFVMVETITTALFDQFHVLRHWHVPVVVGTCSALFLLGIPLCMRGGIKFFQFLDKNITAHSFLFLGLLEVIVASYVYGLNNLMDLIRNRMKVSVCAPFYWYFRLMYLVVTPLFMLVCLIYSWYDRVGNDDPWEVFGIMVALYPFVIVAAGVVYAVVKNWNKGLASLLVATKDFCPEYERRERAAGPQTFELQVPTTPQLPLGG